VANNLSKFFAPKSIVVVGVSKSPGKIGRIIYQNIIESGFGGKVYPVNPNENDINGVVCFKEVLSLPEVPDLAVIAIPSELVVSILKQIGEKGIKNVVIISAGFKEMGGDGEIREKEIVEIAQKFQINILGPNCLGFVNNALPVNATFGTNKVSHGNLRFISQSGALATAMFDWSTENNLGFSDFITLGNKAIINENDVLEYFFNQNKQVNDVSLSACRPIGIYLESISDGKKFIEIARKILVNDPIFVLKPGKSPEARLAMQTHTGAIAGEDDILEAVFEQLGVVRCETMEDFFDLTKAYSFEDIPSGPNVVVISNAGGPVVVSADAISKYSLKLAEFDVETKQELEKILPRQASILNPIDVMGDALADRYVMAAELVLKQMIVDSLLIILTPQVMTQIERTAEMVVELSKKYRKPIFCSFIGGGLVAEGEMILNTNNIPSFRFPERAIKAIGTMWKYGQIKERLKTESLVKTEVVVGTEKIKGLIEYAVRSNQASLDNLTANELVSLAGIPTPVTSLVTNRTEAANFALKVGYPVVLKLSKPGLLHKKSVGGVITDIRNEVMLDQSLSVLERSINHFNENERSKIRIQIQKDIVNGVEVILGIKNDPTFGRVLLFGAGGSLTELIDDKNIWLLPIDEMGVKKLIERAKVFKLINGSQGEPKYAIEKLEKLILNFVRLVEVIPEEAEMEINPVIITLNEVYAVDTKVVIGREEKVVDVLKFEVAKTLNHTILATKFHFFELETEKPFVFEYGQYINVKVANDRINCYSIAGQSAPNRFNLLVDVSPGGPGSKYFEALKVGDLVTYLGPFGVFTLKPNDGSGEVLFIGTGSGCAPLKCMIEAALRKKIINKPIKFIFGLSTSDDVFWSDYFKKLAEEYPNFSFRLVIHRPDEIWHGNTGYVTDLVKREVTEAKNISAYLCGNKQMIEEVTGILLDRGGSPERIYKEKMA
jgi:acetate---CoA ligase (ADP-forming)